MGFWWVQYDVDHVDGHEHVLEQQDQQQHERDADHEHLEQRQQHHKQHEQHHAVPRKMMENRCFERL